MYKSDVTKSGDLDLNEFVTYLTEHEKPCPRLSLLTIKSTSLNRARRSSRTSLSNSTILCLKVKNIKHNGDTSNFDDFPEVVLKIPASSGPVSGQPTSKDWVFINYTFKRFEGLTQSGFIPLLENVQV